MSSRDKDNKSFHDKFKQFFRRNQGTRSRGSFELSDDILRDIGKETPVPQRIKRLKDITERVSCSNLDTDTISKLWKSIEDIFSIDNLELRNTGFIFLINLIKRQNEELKITRAEFFRFIRTHNNPQDVGQRLQLLVALTSNGKNVQHFEEEIGPFLLGWYSDIQHVNNVVEYLELILNIIKFNAVCLNSFILSGLVDLICILCCGTYEPRTISCCLQILETVIAYSNMPSDALPRLIGALCRTVNNEDFCQEAWKVGKNLLGTHMGHASMYTLCLILEEQGLKSQIHLLRGAVFFIHMSLWSSKPVANLCVPPSAVLPSLLEAVRTNHPLICYEVILGMYDLVQKLGLELSKPAWSTVLDIIQHVQNSLESNIGQQPSNLIVTPMHETLDMIENLIDTGCFSGSLRQYFDIIKNCANSRPESSVLRLIEYMSRDIISTEQCWLTNLNHLLNKFFKSDEIRTDIRLAALNVLSGVAHLNRKSYEEELIDNIVIPHCTNIVNDTNITVRSAVAKCLLSLCVSCETKRCVEMLDILEKLMFRPFEVYTDHSPSEQELEDVLILVEGLIDVFVYKLERLPSNHAVRIYKIMVLFLETHYKKPSVFANCYRVRYLIFECFLKMRADDQYRLGYSRDEKNINYSPYLCVTSHSVDKAVVGSPLPQSPALGQHGVQCNITHVSIKRAFRVFISCLERERDWNVLRLVLQELPKVLKNKTLILSKHGNIQLDLLVDVLSPPILDKHFTLPEHFNKTVNRHEYLHLFFMVLVTLPSYHACLDQKHQQFLVRCLSRCIGNSLRTSPKQLIEALTICCLEMRDVMIKMLPEILLTVSKISPTVVIAIPVLEFLSTLTQLPMVYASFVDKQYLSIFAITSPFTNPFKYNHYTVSLAHYVIGVWFLKCRLPIRINSVAFITSALQTNVLTPFEETNFFSKVDLSKLNIDSSDRKRSSSLTEQGPRRRAATVSGGSAAVSGSSGSQENKGQLLMHKGSIPLTISLNAANASVLTFYEELTETCIDLMARYAFSPSSALPRRTPTAEFLLNGGQSMTWLLGNKLVTITTSGCSQKVLKHGLCDKCWHVCSSERQGQKSARSSIENAEAALLTRQNSSDKINPETVAPPEEKTDEEKKDEVQKKLRGMVSADPDKYEKPLCSCWCQAWAEIYVRRPTGDMSWVMRIQNTISSKSSINEFPLKELTHLFMPSVTTGNANDISPATSRVNSSADAVLDIVLQERDRDIDSSNLLIRIPGSSSRDSPSRQSSRDSGDEDMEHIYDDGTKTRNPVRRSNSSPEMSNWKNPFLHSKHDDEKNTEEDGSKKGKLYSKDMRVSCEAIPEEMAGTTPPSNEALPLTDLSLPGKKANNPSQHPSLLSCHSYPGSSPPGESNIAPKAYQSVPPTPNVTATANHPMLQRASLSKNSSSDLSVDSNKSAKDSDKSGLPAHSKLQSVAAKPPQSPTQTSAKGWILKDKEGNEIQKSASASVLDRNTTSNRDTSRDRKSTGNIDKLSDFDPQKRDRTHTVAGTSHGVRKPRSEQLQQLTRPREAPKSGINPSFIFLQIYQKVDFADSKERPILIGTDEPIRRAISNLDRIPPYETHKIGVIYIREGQANKESEILKNSFGSIRYGEFLRRLGTLFKLQDVDPQLHFLGGLSQNGEDGKFSYMWQDDLVKMIFHVATLMPNKDSDPNCHCKKLHIGNDNVTIVYNESGEDYNMNTIRSQFNFASVIIQPMDQNLNRVTVKCKEVLINLMGAGCQETKIVSDQSVAILARQLALHCNLASLVHASLLLSNSQSPYASNWLERLRQIKKIRSRVIDTIDSPPHAENMINSSKSRQKQMEDFTEYT
ncbi:tuberin isoform X2 [Coccinella septempunctata]|uniref:tuberin isoform X2 n=1 Tax=Coccinella septempunctata TaxID=41139 RepID=UPI001D06C956|nr:tuberin isoform X2 [Coccinella septempunctata]